MLNSLAHLHHEIFQIQLKSLQENKDYLSQIIRKNKCHKIPHHLFDEKRASGSKSSALSCLDPFEQTLLQTLDSNNQLNGDIRLNIFLLLLHYIEKIEHKLICIHILRYHTPRISHEKLVQSGFFGILNKWITQCLNQDFNSDDINGIPTLTVICHLLRECYYLDIDVAKKYDILRLIKKIGKVSSTVNSTEELQKAVSDLKTSWQSEVNKEDSAVRAALIKSKLKSEKPTAIAESENTQSVESTSTDSTERNEPEKSMEIKSEAAKEAKEERKSTLSQPAPSSQMSSQVDSNLVTPSPTPNPIPSPAPSKPTIVPARTNHQPLHVLGKLGANQIQDLIQSSGPRQSKSSQRSLDKNQSLTRDESTFEILQQAMLPKIVLVKSSEVKGIMKKNKTTTDGTIEEKPKSAGRLISWNEKLFDIKYFEVEPTNNLTKSTSRLRQEVHQKKIMITSCEWKRPEIREIQPEDKVEVHSFEESIQRKRLSSLLQRFYPDDDDIPSDPEDDPSVEEPKRKTMADCAFIPWDNDEVPSISQEHNVPEPVAPSSVSTFDQSEFMAEEKEPFPYQHHLLNMTSYMPPDNTSTMSTPLSSFASYSPPAVLTSPRATIESYAPKPDQTCWFYHQPGGCRRGAACPYIHENLDKRRVPEPFEIPPSKKIRSTRSPSPPPRFGRVRSPSPPLHRGRTVAVSREPSYFEPIPVPLRKTRDQMKLSSAIYGANRSASPPSPPPLKNPGAYNKIANTVCSAYISGSCRYGYKCHYLHEQMDMFGDIEEEEEEEIPVPKVSPNTWTKSIDRDNTVLVRMRGLPFDVSYTDVIQFFNGTIPYFPYIHLS